MGQKRLVVKAENLVPRGLHLKFLPRHSLLSTLSPPCPSLTHTHTHLFASRSLFVLRTDSVIGYNRRKTRLNMTRSTGATESISFRVKLTDHSWRHTSSLYSPSLWADGVYWRLLEITGNNWRLQWRFTRSYRVSGNSNTQMASTGD